jgi:hypothetical protein
MAVTAAATLPACHCCCCLQVCTCQLGTGIRTHRCRYNRILLLCRLLQQCLQLLQHRFADLARVFLPKKQHHMLHPPPHTPRFVW